MSTIVTGFATKFLQMKMFGRFIFRFCLFVLVLQFVVICIYNSWFNDSWDGTKHLMSSGLGMAWELIKKWHFNGAADVLVNTVGGFFELQHFALTRSCAIWVLFPMLMVYMFLFDEDKDGDQEFIQGRRYIEPKQLNLLALKSKLPIKLLALKNYIPFGQVYLPVGEEIKQTFVAGKPGCGKTNAFNQMLLTIRKRKQKIIVHDYKGDYVEKFYDEKRGDLLFNPLDVRSLNWCLFNDCQSVMDIEGFAAALIPNVVTSEPFWNNAARDILVGILRYCYAENKRTNKDIWEIATQPNFVIYNALRRTKGGEIGAKHLEDPEGKTALSIMSNFMQYIKIFEYMSAMNGDFSIRRWVKDKKESGTIFFTNYASLQHTLSPMISLFIQTISNTLLSQPDDLSNRVFLFLDEFGKLPNMSTIENLMTASRSKGGSVFIGVQDVAQLDKIYKPEGRTTILNSASNRIIFNCKDHDTAKFFSVDFGDTEYYEGTESQSLGSTADDRLNTGRQRRKEPVVTPEDIQSLPDLNAFISIGHYNVTKSKFKYKKLENKVIAFIQREDLDLTNVVDVNPNYTPDIQVKDLSGSHAKGADQEDAAQDVELKNEEATPPVKSATVGGM